MTASSVEREREFALVREIRAAVARVGDGIRPTTADEYRCLFKKMAAAGRLPEDANARATYYRQRAALVFCTAEQARGALRARDRAAPGSPEAAAAVAELKRVRAIFDRYPPDPQRRHIAETAAPGLRWRDVATEKQAAGWQPEGHSKRAGLGRLVRIVGWQDTLLSHVSERYRAAVAVALLSGARPAEIATGVQVADDGDGHLLLTIKGAKCSDTRGQPSRTLLVSVGSTAGRLLSNLATAGGGTVTVAAPAKKMSDAVAAAAHRAWPRLTMRVSGYTIRHAVASNLKAAGVAADLLAQTLGHQTTRSASAYGRAAHGSGTRTPILGVSASAVVRDTAHPPPTGWSPRTLRAAPAGSSSPLLG